MHTTQVRYLSELETRSNLTAVHQNAIRDPLSFLPRYYIKHPTTVRPSVPSFLSLLPLPLPNTIIPSLLHHPVMPLSPRSPQPSPNPHSDRRRALPYTSKAREPAERKHDAKTDFHRGVVLHGSAQVDSFEVLLDSVVGDDAHVELLFGGV
jgi:hypothetical protein